MDMKIIKKLTHYFEPVFLIKRWLNLNRFSHTPTNKVLRWISKQIVANLTLIFQDSLSFFEYLPRGTFPISFGIKKLTKVGGDKRRKRLARFVKVAQKSMSTFWSSFTFIFAWNQVDQTFAKQFPINLVIEKSLSRYALAYS